MDYPSLLRRYMATVIDGLLVIGVLIASAYIFDTESRVLLIIRIALILFMFFVYEPMSTSFLCTLGQCLAGIRVRNQRDMARISLGRAYLRIIIKIILGIISFFTIPFSKNKRALHDMMAGSLVVYKTC